MTESAPATGEARLRIDSRLSPGQDRTLAQDVLDGLGRPLKELPPKHLYDTRGALLFDRICELPEYYQTRTELDILRARADEIASATAAVELVELGSGTAAKTQALMDAMDATGQLRRYVPVDVTDHMVRDSAARLLARYPRLSIRGMVGDFERHLGHLPEATGPRIIVFLGGTIGNLPPVARLEFLSRVGSMLGPHDHLLMGTDLVKDPAIIEAAYNDSQGLTAEFSRNVLHVINRELGGDFDPDAFEHVAFFDPREEWIDIRLRASRALSVRIEALELEVSFAAGEDLRTEISAKFTRESLQRDLSAAGLRIAAWHTDPRQLFAVSLSRRVDGVG